MDDDEEEEDDEPPSPAAAAAIAKKTGILKETTVRAPAPAAGVTASGAAVAAASTLDGAADGWAAVCDDAAGEDVEAWLHQLLSPRARAHLIPLFHSHPLPRPIPLPRCPPVPPSLHLLFFFSRTRRDSVCVNVTGVQGCALAGGVCVCVCREKGARWGGG